ncbi:hypothetical protein [Alkalicoccus luteus]|uniref:Uncharacterized protein n=1 Tax=Alkalicoccus luteus TaxID=1237094 RepID=A0A969TVS6_9BACI|nr:hypothetical protein [Alkalicoccus luteus]NJP38422.1 hypothetical protein [Alkalicoccus luteus]
MDIIGAGLIIAAATLFAGSQIVRELRHVVLNEVQPVSNVFTQPLVVAAMFATVLGCIALYAHLRSRNDNHTKKTSA